ncbi:MAG: hypothetical protein WKG07_37775 [Hymenobacter sp.]
MNVGGDLLFSILIAARDEAAALPALLQALQTQTLPPIPSRSSSPTTTPPTAPPRWCWPLPKAPRLPCASSPYPRPHR